MVNRSVCSRGVIKQNKQACHSTYKRGGGGGGAELFPCPYPPKIQARPPRDQSFGAGGESVS